MPFASFLLQIIKIAQFADIFSLSTLYIIQYYTLPLLAVEGFHSLRGSITNRETFQVKHFHLHNKPSYGT